MASNAIRLAVQSYFQSVAGISTFYKSEPWFAPGEAWTINGVNGTAAFIHLGKQNESIIAFEGQIEVTHFVTIVVLWQYRIPPRTTTGMPDGWSDGLDDLLDAIVLKLRADRTLGTGPGGVVWQAGINDADVEVERDMPVKNNGKIWCQSFVTFRVQEITQA